MEVFVNLNPEEMQFYSALWGYCDTAQEADGTGGSVGALFASVHFFFFSIPLSPPPAFVLCKH